MEKNRSKCIVPEILLLVCLFLLQRCGLLLLGSSHISHPAFDETAGGVLACDLLDGQLRAPLLAYQYEARSGDSLIEGFLLVPFFKLFGRSLFSLKLCALFSSLLTLICWMVLLRRYYGAWAAIVFAALFAFPPPTFARLGLMGTIASHHLMNSLAALHLLCLFRITEAGGAGAGVWWWLGFGLLPGDAFSSLYRTALDRERERCYSLLLRLSSPYAGFVERGFRKGMINITERAPSGSA